jgi:hypothetical protein
MLQDDKKKYAKLIWVAVPLLALFVLGYVCGVYQEGKVITSALANENLSICKDADGNIWVRDAQTNNPALKTKLNQTINYTLGLQN